MKRKNKYILGATGLALSLIALGAGIYGLKTETKTASAAQTTTARCLTYGITTVDDTRTSGSPSSFSVYMYGASISGTDTIYNGELLNWTSYSFFVDADKVSEHKTFQLYKDGVMYYDKSVSGNKDLSYNVGSLTDGNYTLKYECRALNGLISSSDYSYEYSFEVDTTKPMHTVSQLTGDINPYTNQNIAYSAYDVNFSHIRVKHDSGTFNSHYGNSYTVQATEENNGYWYFQAIDKLGNSTTVTTRYLDTIEPIGKCNNQDGDVIENGSSTNVAFIYSATDTRIISTIQYKSPDASTWTLYPRNTTILKSNGWYYFRAIDGAGNVSEEYRVYYDTVEPQGSVYDDSGEIVNGAVTNKSYVKYMASDEGSGVSNLYVQQPGTSTFVNYTSGSQLTVQGTYQFKAYDTAGNVTAEPHKITLDMTAPEGQLKANGADMENNNVVNVNHVSYEASDVYSKVAAYYVKMPGRASFMKYTALTELTEEGEYKFYSVDEAGNQSEISTITIDRSVPTAQLYVGSSVVANGSYTNGQYISFVSDGTCYVKKPGATSYISYVSGTEFYQVGRYEFYAQNAAGTKTETYSIIIDRTPKTVVTSSLANGKKWTDMIIKWTDGDATTTAPITRITINGKNYAFGSIVYTLAEKEYKIVVYDAAGNESTRVFYGGTVDVPTFTMQKEYWEVKDGWSDNVYSFSRYESALSYATTAEKRFVAYKTWNSETWDQGISMDTKDSINAKNGRYYVYKSEDDPEKQVAYFTQERLDEVVKKYAEKTIESWYYWEKESAATCIDGDLNAYAGEKKVAGTKVELREGLIYTLDGVGYTELTITKPGAHTLLIEDGYGGAVEYEIYILYKPQTIQYSLGENTPSTAEFDRTYYFNGEVTITAPFDGDEFAMFEVLNSETGESLGYFDVLDSCCIEKSGRYVARSMNYFGVSEDFNFVVSINAPMVSLTEDADKKCLDIVIMGSVDKESNIIYLELTKSVDGGETWEILTKDDYGAEIALGCLEYHFRTSGIYKVTIMDEFRTGIDAIIGTFDYKQANPVGVLAGVEEFGMTNTTVTFTWADEAFVSLVKDGVPLEYTSGQELMENGEYVLTFGNYDNYQKQYCFTIDRVAPEVTLEGVAIGQKTNRGVSIQLSDGTIAVSLNGEAISYTLGETLTAEGSYCVTATDELGNIAEVGFTIDKTAPIITLDGVEDASKTNGTVTITVAEDATEFKVLLDGEDLSYKVGEELTAEGAYMVTAKDELGNMSGMRFVIDKTAANLVLNGVENGGVSKGEVSLSGLSETATVTVTKDGEMVEYTLGETLNEAGRYVVTVTDECGNVTEYSFEIEEGINVWLIAGAIVGGLALMGGVALLILKKRGVV